MAAKNNEELLRELADFQKIAGLPEKVTSLTYGISQDEVVPRMRIKSMFGFNDETFKKLMKKGVLDEMDRDLYNECSYYWGIPKENPITTKQINPYRILIDMAISIEKYAEDLMKKYEEQGLDIKLEFIADQEATDELIELGALRKKEK